MYKLIFKTQIVTKNYLNKNLRLSFVNNLKYFTTRRKLENSNFPMGIAIQNVTSNIKLYTDKPRDMKLDPKTLRLHKPIENPLVVVCAWYNAQPQHVAKYAEIYIKKGFDVVAIRFSAFEILRPKGKVQVAAQDMLTFLSNNAKTSPLILHGFSGGAYVWGECMVKMEQNLPLYRPILNRFRVQIWDSISDVSDFASGMGKTIFPNNTIMSTVFHGVMLFFLKSLHFFLTKHYKRSSERFHQTFVKCPTLFLLSKNDPIGTEKSNKIFLQDYQAMGIDCTWKCWDKSQHVGHLKLHQKEYLEAVNNHLALIKVGPSL